MRQPASRCIWLPLAVFRAALLWMACCAAGIALADSGSTERAVKAASIYRFLGYVEWPPATFSRQDAPLVIGVAAALAFLALAVGWWILAIAAPVAVVGLVGWVFEFSRGQHAH